MMTMRWWWWEVQTQLAVTAAAVAAVATVAAVAAVVAVVAVAAVVAIVAAVVAAAVAAAITANTLEIVVLAMLAVAAAVAGAMSVQLAMPMPPAVTRRHTAQISPPHYPPVPTLAEPHPVPHRILPPLPTTPLGRGIPSTTY